MKTVILCGGQGTRIREAGEVLPKPMLPIGNRPILWHIMKGYATQGCADFVLCLGYKGWQIKEFFLNYRAMVSDVSVNLPSGTREVRDGAAEDWNVLLAETGEHTMTGARVRKIRRYVEGADEFLLTYGDGLSDVDVGKLLAFHRSHGKIATVTAVRPPGRFGEMRMEDDGGVIEFNEKPQATEGFINGGFFVIDARRVWPYLEGDDDLVLERQPLQRLAADGQLAAYRHTSFWQPMDTFREYQLLNDLWASGRAPWKSW